MGVDFGERLVVDENIRHDAGLHMLVFHDFFDNLFEVLEASDLEVALLAVNNDHFPVLRIDWGCFCRMPRPINIHARASRRRKTSSRVR